MKSKEAYKTIGEVCDILGIVDPETGKRKTHVIRFWESKFKNLKPSLIYKNRRYYSNSNIILLKKIKKLLKDDGHTIQGAIKALSLNNNEIDTSQNTNINTEKVKKFKDKIKNLKKYING
jgi:DNA-binding transcriptional MerR regulator